MEKKNYLTEDNSPGHLFVVQNDLSRLCCDAWMLPTGFFFLLKLNIASTPF